MQEAETWALVLEHESALRRECRRYVPAWMRHELDELYSDVVLGRCTHIMARYDPDRETTPIGFLVINVRWYAYKWVVNRAKQMRDGPESLDRVEATHVTDPTTAIVVQSILDELPEDAAQLLRWRHAMGYSLAEIAEHLGVSKGTVKRLSAQALELAREIAKGRQ